MHVTISENLSQYFKLNVIGFAQMPFHWPLKFSFVEKAYEDQMDDVQEENKSNKRPELDLSDLAQRIDQVAIGDESSSSISTRERGCSDASQDLTSMAEGDMGDLEDNQPDSSAPEDEQVEHSPHQPIGVYDDDDDDDFDDDDEGDIYN